MTDEPRTTDGYPADWNRWYEHGVLVSAFPPTDGMSGHSFYDCVVQLAENPSRTTDEPPGGQMTDKPQLSETTPGDRLTTIPETLPEMAAEIVRLRSTVEKAIRFIRNGNPEYAVELLEDCIYDQQA